MNKQHGATITNVDVNVAYCFDRNYRQHFAAGIYSLVENFNGSSNLNIFILTNEVDPDFIGKIEGMIHLKNCKITWIKFKEENVKNLYISASSHFSSAIYYRLFLPTLLPSHIDKVLYLDSDTICIGDVSPLFNLEINSSAVAGVLDLECDRESKRLGLEKYINSGVLLMNLNIWREHKIPEKCLDWIKNQKKPTLGDQDAINTICQSQLMLIERKWNACINPENMIPLNDAIIFHYISHQKPWQIWYDTELASIYDHYLNQTPWANSPKDNPKNLSQSLLYARKLFSDKKYQESSNVYEKIIQELAKKIK